MAFKTVEIVVLFLIGIIVGTAMASPVRSSTKNFEYSLLETVLKSMNNNSPNNHHYRSGALLELNDISMEHNQLTMKVTVLLEPNCLQESMCPREICDMLITEDMSNVLIVDDQSKQCRYDKKKPSSNYFDHRSKRKATEVDKYDSTIKKFVDEGTKQLGAYKRFNNIFSTVMLNATKEVFPEETKHVIFFELVDPTCTTSGISSNCSISDDSLARLCKINVEEKNQSGFYTRQVTATCEEEQHRLKQ